MDRARRGGSVHRAGRERSRALISLTAVRSSRRCDHAVVFGDAQRPSGSLAQLADAVAARTVDGEEIQPKVVIVDGPRAGDPAEVVVDVVGVGVGDDSIGGFRMRIFAAPTGDANYTVGRVEQIVLCRRGVTNDGFCV